MKEEVYILAQSLQQPRVIKRIIEKSKEYKNVKVYGFKRDFYDVDNLNRLSLHPNIEIIIVGILTNEKYLHRIFLYAKLVFLLNTKAFLKKKGHLYIWARSAGDLLFPDKCQCIL
ncbi:MAG: hypothetical protein ABI166_07940 [Mucilaginibacter sp.]